MLEQSFNMNLAVIQVIKGINFPCDAGELQFKVRWGEEEATMESVCNAANVAVQQEVAFQISRDDRRVLNMDPVYLQCTYTSSNGTQCYVGKVDLPFDLNTKSNQKWYTLKTEVDVNNLETEPSLLLSLFCEYSSEETTTNEDQFKKCKSAESPHGKQLEDVLKPVLVNDEYFLIESPTDRSEQVFHCVSITLSFAENLLDVFPSKSLWPPEHVPFEFRFNLLGSPIQFQPFNCQRNLIEIGERATAKIKCSPKCLLRFLKESMQTFSIFLCCEEIPIAESVVPIKERIESCRLELHILEKLHLEPLNITGIFPLNSLLETDSNENNSASMKPQVGITIRISQAASQSTTNLVQSSPAPGSDHPSVRVSSEPVNTNRDSLNFSSAERHRQEKIQEDLLYATALELEVWKEEQKLLEQEKQERSRASYMELLNNEYRRQTALKEAALQRRVRRVEELEKQLEEVIQTARQTELELQQEKERFSRQRAQLMREKKVVDGEIERVTLNLTNKHKFELEAERRRHTEIVSELRRKLKAEMVKSSEHCERIKELEESLLKLKPA